MMADTDDLDSLLNDIDALDSGPATIKFIPHPPLQERSPSKTINPKIRFSIRHSPQESNLNSNDDYLMSNDDDYNNNNGSFSPPVPKNYNHHDNYTNNENDDSNMNSDTTSIDDLLGMMNSPRICSLNDHDADQDKNKKIGIGIKSAATGIGAVDTPATLNFNINHNHHTNGTNNSSVPMSLYSIPPMTNLDSGVSGQIDEAVYSGDVNDNSNNHSSGNLPAVERVDSSIEALITGSSNNSSGNSRSKLSPNSSNLASSPLILTNTTGRSPKSRLVSHSPSRSPDHRKSGAYGGTGGSIASRMANNSSSSSSSSSSSGRNDGPLNVEAMLNSSLMPDTIQNHIDMPIAAPSLGGRTYDQCLAQSINWNSSGSEVNTNIDTDIDSMNELDNNSEGNLKMNVNYKKFKSLESNQVAHNTANGDSSSSLPPPLQPQGHGDAKNKNRCARVVLAGGSTLRGIKSSMFSKVACDNLRCLQCNFQVKTFIDASWEADVDYMFFRNNMPNDDKLSTKLRAYIGAAAYCCQCSWDTLGINGVDEKTLNPSGGGALQWVCCGHGY